MPESLPRRAGEEDRDYLARLVNAGVATRRDGPYERGHRVLTARFLVDIERRQRRLGRGMDTIRPKRKRKR